MKNVAAWLLLIAISLHLIGSYVCMKIMYPVTYERPMSHAERAIATLLEEETGIRANIVLLSQNQVLPEDIGYNSNYFIFSREMEGKTVFYRIDPDPVKVIQQQSLIYTWHKGQFNTDNRALLSLIFSKFRPGETPMQRVHDAQPANPALLAPASLHESFTPAVPSPPPERA